MARLVRILGMMALSLSVAACGRAAPEEKKVDDSDVGGGLDLARMIGVKKNPPDEFAVIAAAPLEMPKDFAALPSPSPGTVSPRMPDAVSEARAVLLGDGTAQAANARTSVSESALISAAGPTDPNIRTALAADQAVYDAEQDLYVLDRVFPALKGLRGGELNEDLVVPVEERSRLATTSAAPRASGGGIATIPRVAGATGVAVPQPIAVQTPVPVTAPAPAALPATDPVSGAELIYIPE